MGIAYRQINEHRREEGEEHHGSDYEGNDPHVWLSLNNGKIIARHIYEALAAKAPEHSQLFERNYRALIEEIESADRELKQLLAPLEGEILLVFHPAFGYFADEYGLIQEAIETGGSEPTPKQLETLIREAREENIRIIFVQPQFAKKSAETVAAAIEGAVIPIDSLAPDWFDNIKRIAETIKEGIGDTQ